MHRKNGKRWDISWILVKLLCRARHRNQRGTGGVRKELTEYYVSEKNDCLISCGGGELMCEDLDYVDFEKIRKAPAKWYLGYSDNTHFTYLLPTICDTAAVYICVRVISAWSRGINP